MEAEPAVSMIGCRFPGLTGKQLFHRPYQDQID